MKPIRLLLLTLLFCSSDAPSAETHYRITVSAGEWDRTNTLVSFTLPETNRTHTGARLRGNGETVSFQIDPQGRACFIGKNLKKNAVKTYELLLTTRDSAPSSFIEVKREGRVVKISTAGHSILQYQAEPEDLPRSGIKPIYKRGGYLHPVYTPSGKVLTDHFATNHVHQHGIWFPWTKTEFEGRQPDFWNMGQGKGTVEFVSVMDTWSGPVHGGFRSRHRFIDLTSGERKTVLNETWEVTAYQPGANAAYWMFDLVSMQECATASRLKLPKYLYGGLGFRGCEDWNDQGRIRFLTSEGEVDRIKANMTRARWCHIGGDTDRGVAGITILCHPDNFRAPQPMRVHPTEPFFCYAPSQIGDWEITPGKPYVSRYRFIVQDGPSNAAELERLWQDYAHPPEVKIESQ